MIECKSGSQDHDPGSDVLYKIEAVTRQFRALRVRSYLATTGTNILDHAEKVKSSVTNRAAIYNCRILTTTHIQSLVVADANKDVERLRELLFSTVKLQ